MADLGCHVLRVGALSGGARFIVHDCAATHGTSGGPLLTKNERGWAVIAINIAAGKVENLALAAPFGN
jgi:protease YdgD